MSEMEHTPEPWTIIPPEPFEGDEENEAGGFIYPGGIEGGDGNPVCLFGDASGSGTMFENSADHRLIAAAPDLLAAAKLQMAAHAALEGRAGYEKWQAMEDAAIKALRAAIAKATTA